MRAFQSEDTACAKVWRWEAAEFSQGKVTTQWETEGQGLTTTSRSDFLGPCQRKGVSCRVVQTGNHSGCAGGKG